MSIQAKVTGTPNPRAVQLLLDAVDEFLWQQELKRRAAEIRSQCELRSRRNANGECLHRRIQFCPRLSMKRMHLKLAFRWFARLGNRGDGGNFIVSRPCL